MPFIPSGAAHVVNHFQIPGDAGPAMTTFGLTDIGADNADTVAANVLNAWNDTDSPLDAMTTGVTLFQIDVYKGEGGGVISQAELSADSDGRAGGGIATPQVAWLIHKLTGFAGRTNRGRMYLPGVIETQFDDGGFASAAALTSMGDGCDAFLQSLQTSGYQMTILHEDPNLFLVDVTSLQVSNKCATQRRRLR